MKEKRPEVARWGLPFIVTKGYVCHAEEVDELEAYVKLLEKECEEIARELEQTDQIVRYHGVPKTRSKRTSRALMTLLERIRKERESNERIIISLTKENKELRSLIDDYPYWSIDPTSQDHLQWDCRWKEFQDKEN